MTDPEEVGLLIELLEARDLGMAEGNAMQMRVATTLRALVAENERLASIIRECVYDGTEGGECEECGEPIRLDQTWRGDMNNRQWHTPTCADARAQVDDIVAMPRRERDALAAQLAAARADVDDETIARAVASVHSPDFAWAGRSTEQRALFARMGRAAIDAAKGGA